ncbi:MAG: lysophospholipid acyltransferase family protein [Alphaproteobacteria bacterium]|nr:lysophospholipid acyltransferase family protein [Alphaproteobacteria bacterium]
MNWLLIRDRIKIFRQKLSRSAPVQWLAAQFLAQYIRFVFYSNRRILEIPDSSRPYQAGEKNCLFAFWHGRLIMVAPFKPKGRPMHVLISQHNDGELIARTVAHFGITTVRGSTSSGGSKAGRDVVRLYRQGHNVSITPDGPRGPNRKVQAGIVHLARLCDAPVVPIAISTSRHKALKSWDRMQIALPFGRLATCVGTPVNMPREADAEAVETARASLENTLNQLTRRADELVGLSGNVSTTSASQREEHDR